MHCDRMCLKGGDSMEEINERIKRVIAEQGIKQRDLAKALGITESSVSTMCSGKSKPSGQTINDICRLYNVNKQWLETGTGDMYNPLDGVMQISRLMNEVIRTDGSESWQAARKTIIEALAEMPPEFWEQAARLIDEIKNR